METRTMHPAGEKEKQQESSEAQISISANEKSLLTAEELRALHIELMKIENQALYNDNNNRVTQRNYLLLGIFIVSSALLPLAVQNGIVHKQIALFYNILVFFLMLLWRANTDKMGEQNGEILQNEKKAKYHGIQTERAARRKERQTLPLPRYIAGLVRKQAVSIPHVLAVRWGLYYWGTVGLVLSTDLLTLYLAGIAWDPLSLAALFFTAAVPIFIRHQRPVSGKEEA